MRHLIILALLLCPAFAAAQKLESIRLPPGFSIETWAKVCLLYTSPSPRD